MSPRRRKAGAGSAETQSAASSASAYVVPTDPTICYGEPADLVNLGLPGYYCGCPLHAPKLWTEVRGPDGRAVKVLSMVRAAQAPPKGEKTNARQ